MENMQDLTRLQTQVQQMDDRQRSDHDINVRVETKVDNLSVDIKDLKDGISKQLENHEQRIKLIETMLEQSLPVKTSSELQTLKDEFRTFTTTAKTERKTWSIIGGSVGGIVMTILGGLILHFIGKI